MNRILLVDDEPDLVRLVSIRLEAEGYEVIVAIDGHEALAKARADHPDLIILDLMLPKLNGYQVCALLKRDTRFQKTPIILFTALAHENDEKLGYESGADAYIRKPFQGSELLAQIRAVLEKASKGSEKT